jgi:hypothetical protein
VDAADSVNPRRNDQKTPLSVATPRAFFPAGAPGREGAHDDRTWTDDWEDPLHHLFHDYGNKTLYSGRTRTPRQWIVALEQMQRQRYASEHEAAASPAAEESNKNRPSTAESNERDLIDKKAVIGKQHAWSIDTVARFATLFNSHTHGGCGGNMITPHFGLPCIAHAPLYQARL